VKFSVRPSILPNSREFSPLGVNEGVNIIPRGQISPLGAKLNPRCEVHPWGPGVKLRMALCFEHSYYISDNPHLDFGNESSILTDALI
jgi:hypothetical protein